MGWQKGVGLAAHVRVGQCLQSSVLVPVPLAELEAGREGGGGSVCPESVSGDDRVVPVMPGEVG